MKVIINPQYNRLNSFINKIPAIFQTEGKTIYAERNVLKTFSVEGLEVVVKRYKIPHIINRIAYTFFRLTKAERAYEYALKLQKLGVETPAPIAYIEQYSCGLLTYGYFISIFEKDYVDIRDLMDGTLKNADLLKQLSLYIADFQSKGVLHLDMSPGNILYKKEEDKYCFTLIDINRMHFLPSMSDELRYKSFKRLSENKEVLTEIARDYALASHLNESESIKEIIKYSSEFFNSRRFKH